MAQEKSGVPNAGDALPAPKSLLGALGAREARGSSVRAVGSRGAAGIPFPAPGDFWGARFAAAPSTCQGDPMGAEAPRDPGKCPFPGERLGSAAAEGSRASFGWREVAKQFPVFSLFSVNADSAPQMSLLPCPCPLSPHSFTLELSPPRTSRLCIPAAGKGRSPGSLMAFNPWS